MKYIYRLFKSFVLNTIKSAASFLKKNENAKHVYKFLKFFILRINKKTVLFLKNRGNIKYIYVFFISFKTRICKSIIYFFKNNNNTKYIYVFFKPFLLHINEIIVLLVKNRGNIEYIYVLLLAFILPSNKNSYVRISILFFVNSIEFFFATFVTCFVVILSCRALIAVVFYSQYFNAHGYPNHSILDPTFFLSPCQHLMNQY